MSALLTKKSQNKIHDPSFPMSVWRVIWCFVFTSLGLYLCVFPFNPYRALYASRSVHFLIPTGYCFVALSIFYLIALDFGTFQLKPLPKMSSYVIFGFCTLSFHSSWFLSLLVAFTVLALSVPYSAYDGIVIFPFIIRIGYVLFQLSRIIKALFKTFKTNLRTSLFSFSSPSMLDDEQKISEILLESKKTSAILDSQKRIELLLSELNFSKTPVDLILDYSEDEAPFVSRLENVEQEPLKILGPISGIDKTPLCCLSRALEPLHGIIPDLKVHLQAAEDFAKQLLDSKNNKENLSVDEIGAINLYTQAWEPLSNSLYYILNERLRAEEREKVTPFFRYLKLLFKAFEKLPKTHQKLWRGVKLDLRPEYRQKKNEKAAVIWYSVSSFTLNLGVLDDERYLGQEGKRTLFSLLTKSGVDIQRYSMYKKEAEILLPPGMRFHVNTVLNQGDLSIIDLEEQPTCSIY